jgi:hypothetical protein
MTNHFERHLIHPNYFSFQFLAHEASNSSSSFHLNPDEILPEMSTKHEISFTHERVTRDNDPSKLPIHAQSDDQVYLHVLSLKLTNATILMAPTGMKKSKSNLITFHIAIPLRANFLFSINTADLIFPHKNRSSSKMKYHQ